MARRHETLIPLSHDHHDALMLAWRLRGGDLCKREPELRASHISAFFEYRLIKHFKLEEDVVFPAVRAVLGPEASLVDELLGDHRELRANAASIKAGARGTKLTISAICSIAISGPRNPTLALKYRTTLAELWLSGSECDGRKHREQDVSRSSKMRQNNSSRQV